MKGIKFYFTIVILTMLFSSCFTGFFPTTEESITGIERHHTTRVRFNNNTGGLNLFNRHRVSVFSDMNRQTKIGQDVAPNSTSGFFECTPSNLFSFYLTYHLTIGGVNIPYNPPLERGGWLPFPVKRNEDNTVPIPPLAEVMTGQLNDLLITDAFYLAIKNNGSFVMSLMAGIMTQIPVNSIEPYIQPGQTGIYRLENQTLSGLNILVLLNTYPFPINTAYRGNVYLFDFDGNDILHNPATDVIEITVSNSLK